MDQPFQVHKDHLSDASARETLSHLTKAPHDAASLAAIWNMNAPARWSELSAQNDASYRALSNHVRSVLQRFLPPPARVLDAGCGLGYTTNALADSGYSVTGIDPSTRSIDIATREFPRLEFRPLSIEELADTREDRPYDCILANMVLHSVPDLTTFFRAVTKLLTPGGMFLATVPHPAFYLSGKLGLALDPAAYGITDGILIEFRIHGGTPHPARIPFFQRKISEYTDQMVLAGLMGTKLIEKRSIGPGREYDILTMLAWKSQALSL